LNKIIFFVRQGKMKNEKPINPKLKTSEHNYFLKEIVIYIHYYDIKLTAWTRKFQVFKILVD